MYIERQIKAQILPRLESGKIIIIYGPRQVGKTTLLNNIVNLLPNEKIKFINGDDFLVRDQLTNPTIESLIQYLKGYTLLIIDEAQYIQNIGITLKLIHDHIKGLKVIVTGSSSFELANKVVEPLTGRNYEFFVLPFSFQEIENHFGLQKAEDGLEQRLIFGSYPEIVLGEQDINLKLQKLVSDYTSKDILKFDKIRKPDKLVTLLKALALQAGQEVSYSEIGQNYGIDKETVNRYMTILEQSFIIFRLDPYMGNERMALRKIKKVYFWDVGLRNAIINNLNSTSLRVDKGHLFENYIVSETLKNNYNKLEFKKFYYWRAYNGEEIDLLVEKDGELKGYEIKFNYKESLLYLSDKAPIKKVEVITSKNYKNFI